MTSKPPKIMRTDLESNLQTKIAKWLRSKGCFVMVLTPGKGIPRGVSDVFFCYEGFYGFLEVKKAKNAKRQPGQEQFVKKMDEWSFARIVYPENYEEVLKEIEAML